MVKVRSIAWRDEAWEVRFEIKEGVYHLDDYPVRISHLGRLPQADVESDLAAVAAGLLERHMRRGAVPPHAVVINWNRVDQLSRGASDELLQAIYRLGAARSTSLAASAP
jgi:hypothetical protein